MKKDAFKIILELDNDERIGSFVLKDGFILWLQIRYQVLNELLEVKSDFINEINGSKPIGKVLKKSFSTFFYYIKVFIFSPFKFKRKFDGLNFSTTLGTFMEDGYTYKSRVNHFFNDYRNVLNLFVSKSGNFNLPYTEPFALTDLLFIKSNIKRKFIRPKIDKLELNNIAELIMCLKEKIGTNSIDFARLEDNLNHFYLNYYNIKKSIANLLLNTKPNFIVIEDGNYGGSINTQLIYESSMKKIPSIEVQHGILGLAYKYGENLLANDNFKFHKTNYLLTYGKYWNDEIRCSTLGFDIGYPYLESKIKCVNISDCNQILFVSQHTIAKSLIHFAVDLSVRINKKYSILFRLHPIEDINDSKFDILRNIENIVISNTGDIYDSLQNCKCIVGSYSAVIYEASLFGKSVFVHENEFSNKYIPIGIGKRFKDENELFQLIENMDNFENLNEENLFWTLDSKNRINEFLAFSGL